MSHNQISGWAHCQRQVAFFAPAGVEMGQDEDLHHAIKDGDTEKVKQLIQSGASINHLFGMQV